MAKVRRPKSVLIIGISMIALGLIFGVLSANSFTKQKPAAATVQTFLEALANNDAATALALLQSPPKNAVLLTNNVLQAANAKHPIKKIATKDQTYSDSSVYATYQIGNQTATQVFALTNTPSGWRINSGTATLAIGKTSGDLPITVNGVSVKAGQEFLVFPGYYAVSSETPVVQLTQAEALVKLVDTKYQVNPVPSLSESGQSAVLNEAKKSLANCLASKEIKNNDCPNVVSASGTIVVDKDTVQWSLLNDPWHGVKFVPGEGNTVQAAIDVDFKLKLKFADEGDYQSGNQDISYKNVRVVVDITTNPMTVTWPR